MITVYLVVSLHINYMNFEKQILKCRKFMIDPQNHQKLPKSSFLRTARATLKKINASPKVCRPATHFGIECQQ